jgi:hypothetical protein
MTDTPIGHTPAMDAPLSDLINRLERVVNDPEHRTLMLHWSDVELLRSVQKELRFRERQAEIRNNAAFVAAALLSRTPKP